MLQPCFKDLYDIINSLASDYAPGTRDFDPDCDVIDELVSPRMRLRMGGKTGRG